MLKKKMPVMVKKKIVKVKFGKRIDLILFNIIIFYVREAFLKQEK